VSDIAPNTRDFYRYYEVPGLGHCFGGVSGSPTGLFEQLTAWVEGGTVPEQTPVKVAVGNATHDRILCPYPQLSEFSSSCGDASKAQCWSCSAMPSGSAKQLRHDL
jgi:hypothetical protein